MNLEIMRLLDEQFLEAPSYGRSKYTEWLRRQGYHVNHKRVGRLLRILGIVAVVPKPSTTLNNRAHQTYPYLLKGMKIDRCNQVWAADITWIPTAEGYLYLVAIIDWYSRYIMSWKLSDTLSSDFCLLALEEAFAWGTPEIFNTDQGVQFTCGDFTELLKCRDVRISMDGKGRYWDNIIVERLWRTIKYEEVYLKRYETGEEAYEGLSGYISFYNEKRIHQSLNYWTPAEVYFQGSTERTTPLLMKKGA
jgi:putative transposase